MLFLLWTFIDMAHCPPVRELTGKTQNGTMVEKVSDAAGFGAAAGKKGGFLCESNCPAARLPRCGERCFPVT